MEVLHLNMAFSSSKDGRPTFLKILLNGVFSCKYCGVLWGFYAFCGGKLPDEIFDLAA